MPGVFCRWAIGFDFFYGFANTGIDYWTHERYRHSVDVPQQRADQRRRLRHGIVWSRSMGFIRENSTRPFFLYLAFNAPHGASNLEKTGVQAPKEYVEMYPESMKEKRRTYLGAITCMDTAIGQILAELEQRKLADNTIVIFTSDNGGTSTQANGPLAVTRISFLKGGCVPCLVRRPGKIPAGTVNRDLLTTLEFFPTLLAAAGERRLPGWRSTASTFARYWPAALHRPRRKCMGTSARPRGTPRQLQMGRLGRGQGALRSEQ